MKCMLGALSFFYFYPDPDAHPDSDSDPYPKNHKGRTKKCSLDLVSVLAENNYDVHVNGIADKKLVY